MTWNTVKDFSTSSIRRWYHGWGVRETDKISPLHFYLKQPRRDAGSVWSPLPFRRHVYSEWKWYWQVSCDSFWRPHRFCKDTWLHMEALGDGGIEPSHRKDNVVLRVGGRWPPHLTGALRCSYFTTQAWQLPHPDLGEENKNQLAKSLLGYNHLLWTGLKRDWSCLWINSSKTIRSLGPCSCCTLRVIRTPCGSHCMTPCPRVRSL